MIKTKYLLLLSASLLAGCGSEAYTLESANKIESDLTLEVYETKLRLNKLSDALGLNVKNVDLVENRGAFNSFTVSEIRKDIEEYEVFFEKHDDLKTKHFKPQLKALKNYESFIIYSQMKVESSDSYEDMNKLINKDFQSKLKGFDELVLKSQESKDNGEDDEARDYIQKATNLTRDRGFKQAYTKSCFRETLSSCTPNYIEEGGKYNVSKKFLKLGKRLLTEELMRTAPISDFEELDAKSIAEHFIAVVDAIYESREVIDDGLEDGDTISISDVDTYKANVNYSLYFSYEVDGFLKYTRAAFRTSEEENVILPAINGGIYTHPVQTGLGDLNNFSLPTQNLHKSKRSAMDIVKENYNQKIEA